MIRSNVQKAAGISHVLLLAILLSGALLAGCAGQAGAGSRQAGGFDQVLLSKGSGSAPSLLYLVLTRASEPSPDTGHWTDADDNDDLASRVVSHAQLALQEVDAHGAGNLRVIFFVRALSDTKTGKAIELTVEELRRIVAESRSEARKELLAKQWIILRLPSDLN